MQSTQLLLSKWKKEDTEFTEWRKAWCKNSNQKNKRKERKEKKTSHDKQKSL